MTLSLATVTTALPFHIWLGEDGHIGSFGAGIQRLRPTLREGDPLAEHGKLQRRAGGALLWLTGAEFPVRGRVHPSAGGELFIGQPAATRLEQLLDAGLDLDDLADDPGVDGLLGSALATARVVTLEDAARRARDALAGATDAWQCARDDRARALEREARTACALDELLATLRDLSASVDAMRQSSDTAAAECLSRHANAALEAARRARSGSGGD